MGENIYLFGGWKELGYCNNLHCFDVNFLTLEEKSTKGSIPKIRGRHGTAVIGNLLFVFGGCYK